MAQECVDHEPERAGRTLPTCSHRRAHCIPVCRDSPRPEHPIHPRAYARGSEKAGSDCDEVQGAREGPQEIYRAAQIDSFLPAASLIGNPDT